MLVIPKSRPNTCFICALPVTEHINATSAPGVGYVHPWKSLCSILTDLIVETGPSSMPDISWDHVIDFYDSFKFQFLVSLQNPEHIKLSKVMQVAEFLQEQHKDPFVFGHPLPPPVQTPPPKNLPKAPSPLPVQTPMLNRTSKSLIPPSLTPMPPVQLVSDNEDPAEGVSDGDSCEESLKPIRRGHGQPPGSKNKSGQVDRAVTHFTCSNAKEAGRSLSSDGKHKADNVEGVEEPSNKQKKTCQT